MGGIGRIIVAFLVSRLGINSLTRMVGTTSLKSLNLQVITMIMSTMPTKIIDTITVITIIRAISLLSDERFCSLISFFLSCCP